jgi:hypothetical protein
MDPRAEGVDPNWNSAPSALRGGQKGVEFNEYPLGGHQGFGGWGRPAWAMDLTIKTNEFP